MRIDYLNDMIVKLSVLEVTLEGAREQIQEIRDELKREPVPSAAQTAVAQPENLIVGKVDAQPTGNDPIKGKRRSKCFNCSAMHWNNKNKLCDTCKAALPIGVT